jgi:hypothetical protein
VNLVQGVFLKGCVPYDTGITLTAYQFIEPAYSKDLRPETVNDGRYVLSIEGKTPVLVDVRFKKPVLSKGFPEENLVKDEA